MSEELKTILFAFCGLIAGCIVVFIYYCILDLIDQKREKQRMKQFWKDLEESNKKFDEALANQDYDECNRILERQKYL